MRLIALVNGSLVLRSSFSPRPPRLHALDCLCWASERPIERVFPRGAGPICGPRIMDAWSQMPSWSTICFHHRPSTLPGFNTHVPPAVKHTDGLPQMSGHLPANSEPGQCPGRGQSLYSGHPLKPGSMTGTVKASSYIPLGKWFLLRVLL